MKATLRIGVVAAFSLVFLEAPYAQDEGGNEIVVVREDVVIPPVTPRQLFSSWKGSKFAYVINGKRVGSITFQNDVYNMDGEDIVEMTDTFMVKIEGKRYTGEYSTICDLSHRTLPIRMQGNGLAASKLSPVEIEFLVDGVTGVFRGEPVDLQVEGPVATDFSIIRTAALMPFEEGATFRFHVLDTARLGLVRDRTIKCMGHVKVDINGHSQELWEFRYADEHGFNQLYFDNGRVLRYGRFRDYIEWIRPGM